MDFEAQLKQWCNTPSGPYRRPFSPNPNWSTADVIIIGTNPATPLREQFSSFDEYWASLTLHPDLFWSRYAAQHSGGTSKSTCWTMKLIELVSPLNCLVTNTCWYPVQKQKEIPRTEWELARQTLKALISQIRPKVVFCHGSKAEEFARSLGVHLDRYQPPETQHLMLNDSLFLAYHHFSGQGLHKGTKFDPATELPRFAERIKQHSSST